MIAAVVLAIGFPCVTPLLKSVGGAAGGLGVGGTDVGGATGAGCRATGDHCVSPLDTATLFTFGPLRSDACARTIKLRPAAFLEFDANSPVARSAAGIGT